MTAAERERIQRLVDAAPPLASEDLDRMRGLMPMSATKRPRPATAATARRPRPAAA